MTKFFTLLFFIAGFASFGQGIAIGEWRDELPYRQAIALGVSETTVYGVTPFSLFTLNKSENNMNRYSKINGLSDFGVSTLEYSKDKDVVFVAYTNTNIDLIKNGNIINIADIKRKQILGKKTINNVYIVEEVAYLSCGFGIVLIDIDREEIKDTWYIGENGIATEVFDVTIFGDSVYAATENGIRVASLDAPNLADFQYWQNNSTVPNADGAFTQIETQKSHLVASYHPENNSDEIYLFDGQSWTMLEDPEKKLVKNICSGNDFLYIVRNFSIELFNDNFEYTKKIYTYGFADNLFPSDIAEDNGTYWIADEAHGLVKTDNLNSFNNFVLNGPSTNNIFDMDAKADRLVVAPGGRTDSYNNIFNQDGIFTKTNDGWTNFTKRNTDALDTIFDLVCVSINPLNTNQYALGSWGRGVTVFDENGHVDNYGTTNSSLTPVNGNPDILRVGGVAYDNNGILWVNSASSNALMHKRDIDGEWTAYELGASSIVDVGKMTIDSRGYKWIQLRQGGGNYVLVFDENQPDGQQLKGLNGFSGNGNIPGDAVTAVADDLDGEIWLGTDAGIAVIYNPSAIFNGGDFDAQRIVVEKDGYLQNLLESETVKAIAVDGNNRKWVGTQRSGVFLLSPNGEEEIHHFTEENSPLYSNNINAISILKNGEVYIGTDKGILAYKSEATPPGIVFDDVYAYPNPVRPDYAGTIAISGLVRDANIRITDAYGGLVHASQAFGGQAIWDGFNMNGEKVKSGVYMVFISDDDGNNTMVTKILFIK
jgi:hypothetical protein